MNRNQRHMERLHRRRKRRIILSVILGLMVITTCTLAAVSYFSTDVYKDEKEFEEYAREELNKSDQFIMEGQTKVDYQYGDPISYVVEYSVCDDKDIAAFRDSRVEEIKARYKETKDAEEAARAKESGKDEDYRPLEHALIVKAGVYQSERGVESLVIMETDNGEKNKEMARDGASIHTYQFLKGTGKVMVPRQIFNDSYREICSQYFADYFRKNYEKEELADDWEKYVAADENNFNKFALSDRGITFFFDEGTILKKSGGIVAAGMSLSDMGAGLREKPLERYIDPSRPMVALTYDDGPGGTAEARILACLKRYGEVATFFYLGNRVAGDSVNVKTAYDMGCEIGNHTWNHPKLTKLKPEELVKQFADTNAAIKAVTGADPTVFRPSYGITDENINRTSAMPVIMWTVDTMDWKDRDGKKVLASVSKEGDLDGKIILMHSIYESTADATELLIPYLREKGYQLVTVSELIRYKTGGEPQPGYIYRNF